MNNTDTRFDNLDATCRSLILEEIKKLNNEGFDTSHYIVDGGWTQEDYDYPWVPMRSHII